MTSLGATLNLVGVRIADTSMSKQESWMIDGIRVRYETEEERAERHRLDGYPVRVLLHVVPGAPAPKADRRRR